MRKVDKGQGQHVFARLKVGTSLSELLVKMSRFILKVEMSRLELEIE